MEKNQKVPDCLLVLVLSAPRRKAPAARTFSPPSTMPVMASLLGSSSPASSASTSEGVMAGKPTL